MPAAHPHLPAGKLPAPLQPRRRGFFKERAMAKPPKYRFQVWLDENPRWFPTFAAAERYAHRYVAASVDERGFSKRLDITHDLYRVAVVRMDALDRVWTDVIATELI
jgi:hypothetical protein